MSGIDVITNRLTPEQEAELDEMERQGATARERLDYILSTGPGTLDPGSPSAQPQQESGGLETLAELAFPLSSATWKNTENMEDSWTSAEGLARKAARAGAVAGDVGLTFAPVGKAATTAVAGAKIAKPVIAGASEIARASHGGALAKEANTAKHAIRKGLEGGIDAAAYDTAVNTASSGELEGPGLGAVAGGSILSGAAGGLLGGRQDKIRNEALNAKKTYKKSYADAIREQHNAKKAIRAGASSSNENTNFAQRVTGLKGDEAISKVIESNMKPGERVSDVVSRLEKELNEANKTFDDMIGEYGNLKLKTPLNKLGDELGKRVRDSSGIGFSQDKSIADHFRDIFNNDLAALAREKMQRQGIDEQTIDRTLSPDGKNLNMNAVYNKLGNSLTLNELDRIKRNMWAKTGLFRRNALSMQEAGEKNIASHEGGGAILGHLRDYSDKEIEILDKIGGSIDGELTRLGAQYLRSVEKDGVVPGKITSLYLRMNRERSNLVGTKKIFDGAFKSLERSNKADLAIYPSKEWHRLAKEAAEAKLAETKPDFPVEKMNEMIKPYVAPFYSLDRMAGQLGQRLGRTAVPPDNGRGLRNMKQNNMGVWVGQRADGSWELAQ